MTSILRAQRTLGEGAWKWVVGALVLGILGFVAFKFVGTWRLNAKAQSKVAAALSGHSKDAVSEEKATEQIRKILAELKIKPDKDGIEVRVDKGASKVIATVRWTGHITWPFLKKRTVRRHSFTVSRPLLR